MSYCSSTDHDMVYCSTSRERIHLVEYWNGRHTSQPDVARVARDMLTTPMMSAECERVFSSDKNLFFFSSRRRHTRLQGDWSSDVCSSDLVQERYLDPRQVYRKIEPVSLQELT